MRNDDDATGEQSERDEAPLAVIEAVVEDRDRHALEELLDADEIDPVLPQVRPALGYIPFKLYRRECNYRT